MTLLEQLQVALDARTQEAWVCQPIELYEGGEGIEVAAGDEVIANSQTYYPQAITVPNARFIALAHNTMPLLLEAVAELGRFVDYLSVAGDDGAYDKELDRAIALLGKLGKEVQ